MKQIAAINLGQQFFGGYNAIGSGTLSGIGSLVSLFLNIAFILAGLILLFFFILGGIGMIGSAGEDNPQKAEQAKKTITSAIIGFVIVFAAYWIVKLIGGLVGIPDLLI